MSQLSMRNAALLDEVNRLTVELEQAHEQIARLRADLRKYVETIRTESKPEMTKPPRCSR